MSDTVERDLHVPDLSEVANVIKDALKSEFKDSDASVVPCPDLTQPPFSLASPGFGGKTSITDVGGVKFMEFVANHNKYHFDITKIGEQINLPFFIGACASCPAEAALKDNSELIPNTNVKTGKNLTKEAYVDKHSGKSVLADYNSNKFTCLGNLFASEGEKGDVIKVTAHVRTGKTNIVTVIRQALEKHYGDKQVGLGGVLLIKQGKFKSHVMPGYPQCDVYQKDIPWLTFYEVEAPATCLSVLVSKDTHDDELRLEHTHFFTTKNDGGHYHYDTTPETIEYEGYYAISKKLYRIGKHHFPK